MTKENQTIFAGIAVTGRIPGDDEDRTFVFEGMTRAEAITQFEDEIYATEKSPEASRADVLAEHGRAVFLTSVLVSDAPIREVDDSPRSPRALPRVVVVLTEGGVLEAFADAGVDVATFDWQDYLMTDDAKQAQSMALPERFAGLAPADTPIKTESNPEFVFRDSRPIGNGATVKASFGFYRCGTPAIRLTDVADGSPHATCTIAWKQLPPADVLDGKPRQCVWVKDCAENEGITQLLVDAGILDRNWAEAHASMPGDPCPQLLTDKAALALERCDRPAASQKPSRSLGM